MRKDTIQPIKIARQSDEVDLRQLIGTLWRGKRKILLCVLIAVLMGGYYGFQMAVPMYTASTTVALESRDNQIIDIDTVMSGLAVDQATINTEAQVLKARILLGKLAQQLDLVSDPEFNRHLRPANPWSLGSLLQRAGLRGAPTTPPADRKVFDQVISALLGKITIRNVRNSYVFQIIAVTESPEKSAQIADALGGLYIQDQLTSKLEATEQATVWLTDRVSELRVELETAEKVVKDHNTVTELVSPEALAALNRQMKDMRSRLNKDQLTFDEIERQIATMTQAKAQADIKTMVFAAKDDRLTRTADLVQRGSEGARTAFDAQFDQIMLRLQKEYDRLRIQIETLASSVADKQVKVEAQSADLVKLQQLEREATASGLIYEYFLSRLKEMSIQQGIHQADSRILSFAVVPDGPSRPRRAMILVLSALLGGFVGAVLVLLYEMRQTGFRHAEELEQFTGVTVIGQIPLAPRARRKKILEYIVSKPASAMVEAIRNLRTSILLSNVDNPPQIIMLTSSVPGEGKTTQSLALAHNLSGMNKKVLLIEGDIRRRTFQEYFDIKGMRGLLSVVSETASLEDTVWQSEQLGVDILIGEISKINAADFFSSEKFREFLERSRKVYDVILIDTTPVLVVPDARVIAQSVDAVVYVVRWDQTPRSLVEQGLHALETVNVPVTGLVLNQIDPKGMKGYGDRYGAAYAGYSDKYYRN